MSLTQATSDVTGTQRSAFKDRRMRQNRYALRTFSWLFESQDGIFMKTKVNYQLLKIHVKYIRWSGNYDVFDLANCTLTADQLFASNMGTL